MSVRDSFGVPWLESAFATARERLARLVARAPSVGAPAGNTPFERALAHTVGIEADYSNDPQDSGGATRFGITERVARANGYQGDMRDMPFGVAKLIYRYQYWNTLRLDDVATISEPVAAELFDTGVNVGIGQAAMFLQRALNALNANGTRWPDMAVDGIVGPVTLDAIRAQMKRPDGERVLLAALNSLQGEFYIALAERLPKNERFAAGWLAKRVAQ